MSAIAFAAAMLNVAPLQLKQAMAAIESPCINVCIVDQDSAFCVGCRRTLAEIAAWSCYTADERRHIMADLPRRVCRPSATVATTAEIT